MKAPEGAPASRWRPLALWGALAAVGLVLLVGGGFAAVLWITDTPSVEETEEEVAPEVLAADPPPISVVEAGAVQELVKEAPAAPSTGVMSEHRPFRWVRIEGGSFSMGGTDRDSYDWETQVHSVTLAAFRMSETPVTVGQWGECVEAGGGCMWPDTESALCNADEHGPKEGRLDHPMSCVTWKEARTFASWKNGGLPSEAQWEYAARAGTATRFWSGDQDGDLARVGWYWGFSGGTTHPVAAKDPNPWGLYDMHGNVWEWCEDDWHSGYEGAPDDGSAWIDSPERGALRVIRGGSFHNDARRCRSAYRAGGHPTDRWLNQGFRVVLLAPQSG